MIKDGYHGDTSRTFLGRGHAAGRALRNTHECPWIGSIDRSFLAPTLAILAGYPEYAEACGYSAVQEFAATALAGFGEEPRAALRPRWHRRRAAAGHDFHHRTDDQRPSVS